MIFSSLAASFSSLFPALVLGAYSDGAIARDGVGFALGVVCIFFVVYIAVIIFLIIVPLMKIFGKAGQPAWQAWVPILNILVLAHIVGRPAWWGIVPILNWIVLFDLAKAFGKSDGFGIGLIFLGPIFISILGYGESQFVIERRAPLV